MDQARVSDKPCWAVHPRLVRRMNCDRPRGHTGSHGGNHPDGSRSWWDSELWRFRGYLGGTPGRRAYLYRRTSGPALGPYEAILWQHQFSRRTS